MIYSFSTYVFDAAALELARDGRRVAIEPQPARALALLLSRAGEVVTREEMRQAIWGADTHVDYDRGLAYCIGQVRSTLRDSAEQPRFVQTLPRRGFRFLAPVAVAAAPPSSAPPHAPVAVAEPAPQPAPPPPPTPTPSPVVTPTSAAMAASSPPAAAAPTRGPSRRWAIAAVAVVALSAAAVAWRASATARRPVVAVSIFDNETGDPRHDAFVTGLSDVVVTALTNLAPERLGVVGNAAALRQPRNLRNLKALAAAVEADYVVIGQLQRQDDDRLRFILHFIRLSDEVHLSAQRFFRPINDAAAFERDVVDEARRVVQQFVVDPSGS